MASGAAAVAAAAGTAGACAPPPCYAVVRRPDAAGRGAGERGPMEADLDITISLVKQGMATGLKMSVPEATSRALGSPPAIRFLRDATGQHRIAAAQLTDEGAIPIVPMRIALPASGLPIAPPPLPPGRYVLGPAGDGTLIVLGRAIERASDPG